MKKFRLFISIGLVTLVAILVLVLMNTGSNHQNSGSQVRSPAAALSVSATIVRAEQFAEELMLTGVVMPSEEVTIYSEVSGRIDSIYVQEGTVVQRGQIIASLYNADVRARLQKILAQYHLDSLQLERLENLRKIDGVSAQELDAARAQLMVRRAEIAEAKATLEKTRIVAPFSGTVGVRDVSPGAVVTTQSPIIKLADLRRLKLDVFVPDRYAQAVRIGGVLRCVIRHRLGTDTLNARVYAMDPSMESETRTLRVRCAIEPQSSSGIVAAGAVAEVRLGTAKLDRALLVPSESVQQGMKGSSVYVINNGVAREQPVTLGSRTSDKVHVLTGLVDGDTIATSGLLALKNGSPVRAMVSQ